MLSGRELYRIWAPADSIWSPWVAPAFFAQMQCGQVSSETSENLPSLDWFEAQANPGCAVILDLPGAQSIQSAMELSRIGYRPVFLINASPTSFSFLATQQDQNVVLDMSMLVRAVCATAEHLQSLSLPANAPPVFVLDAYRRIGTSPLRDEMFDNRWIVFPQDFPSARFLAEQRIRRIILVQAENRSPQEDLAHVLLRWQEAGLAVQHKIAGESTHPVPISVSRPSQFRAMWYRALAVVGLRRSSVGGFGSFIPSTTSTG